MGNRARINQELLLRQHYESQNSGAWGDTWGAQLERAAVLAGHSKPCLRCGGKWAKWSRPERGKPQELLEPEVGGSGWCLDRAAYRQRFGHTPPAGDHSLDVETARALRAAGADPLELYPVPDRICPDCAGRGWVVRAGHARPHGQLTAQPTGSSKSGRAPSHTGAVTSDDSELVQVWLSRLKRKSPVSLETLDQWMRGGGDEIVVLWPLTAPGRRLLRQRGGPQGLHPLSWARSESDAQRLGGSRNSALVVESNRAAWRILCDAVADWNLIAPVHLDRRRESLVAAIRRDTAA